MNYFNGHRFRSRATVIVGDPIEISQETIEKYNKDNDSKKEVVTQLLQHIELCLKNVIVQMYGGETTYDLLWIARQLYTPKNVNLNLLDKVQLTINFSKAYQKIGDYPELVSFKEECERYRKILNAFGIRDSMVRDEAYNSIRKKLTLFIKNLLFVLILIIFALPGGVLMLIPGYICSFLGKRNAKKNVKESLVKISGKDAMLSTKVYIYIFILLYRWLLQLLYFHFSLFYMLLYIPVTECSLVINQLHIINFLV